MSHQQLWLWINQTWLLEMPYHVFSQAPSKEEKHFSETQQRAACERNKRSAQLQHIESNIKAAYLKITLQGRQRRLKEEIIHLSIVHTIKVNFLTKHIGNSEKKVTFQLNSRIIARKSFQLGLRRNNLNSQTYMIPHWKFAPKNQMRDRFMIRTQNSD